VRTLEQLEAARAKRVDETTGLKAFASVSSSRRASTPASGASSARPRSPLQSPEWCAGLNEEDSAFYGKHPRDGFESPSMTHENIAPTMPVFAADPRYMAHVENGAWVCSFPSCLHPIEVHRSDPATADVHKQLQDPPASSNLSILAPFVGRVGAVSPRAPSHGSNNGHIAPHDVPNNAFIARCRMGNYADICCVCGYPAAQRYHRYPLWKTSKYGETLRPGVTMAHVLAPDALAAVGFADDETNYLPLCGTLGWEGSCHDAFDKNLILFAYEGGRKNDGRYVVWASDPEYRHF
jgi:hypothetical protein